GRNLLGGGEVQGATGSCEARFDDRFELDDRPYLPGGGPSERRRPGRSPPVRRKSLRIDSGASPRSLSSASQSPVGAAGLRRSAPTYGALSRAEDVGARDSGSPEVLGKAAGVRLRTLTPTRRVHQLCPERCQTKTIRSNNL